MKLDNIKLVIFDLDGTLINAYPAIYDSFNFTMRFLHYPVLDRDTIRRAVGWGDRNLLKPYVKPRDLNKALSVYRKHHKNSLIKKSTLFGRVKELLGYLKNKGYRIAVASNRPARFSMILIRHLGIKRYFDYVLCADKLTYGKPHPQILNTIMRRFKVSPRQTVYTGDMMIDAEAGRRAGVNTIMVTTGSSTEEEILKQRPLLIINNIIKLKGIL